MPKTRAESLAMLREGHTFPTTYMFKLIGENTADFVARACQAVGGVTGDMKAIQVETRVSSKGHHQGVTLRAMVRSAEDVLTIFDHLGQLPGLRMVL